MVHRVRCITIDDTITYNNHRFVTGQRVTFIVIVGTAIVFLVDGTAYYIIKNDENSIKLATTYRMHLLVLQLI